MNTETMIRFSGGILHRACVRVGSIKGHDSTAILFRLLLFVSDFSGINLIDGCQLEEVVIGGLGPRVFILN